MTERSDLPTEPSGAVSRRRVRAPQVPIGLRPAPSDDELETNILERWQGLGATHLAVATHNAGPTDVDGHLARITEYLAAVRG